MSPVLLLVALSCGCICCAQAAVVSDPRGADVQKNVAENIDVPRESVADGVESHDSTFAVDYVKGITGIHDVESGRCYLIAAVPETVLAVSEVKQDLGEHVDDSEVTGEYQVSEEDRVEDLTLLPTPLREGCAGLPLHWMEPSGETRADKSDVAGTVLRARFCWRVCVVINGRRICYIRCR